MGRVSALAPSESGRAETEALGRGDRLSFVGMLWQEGRTSEEKDRGVLPGLDRRPPTCPL